VRAARETAAAPETRAGEAPAGAAVASGAVGLARLVGALAFGSALALFGPAAVFLPHSVLAPGLDPSWVFALGRLPDLPDVVPGRDWVFTYGPLAHWLVPPALGYTIYGSAALRVLGHLALVALIVVAGRRRTRTLAAVTVGWLAAVALGLEVSGALVLLSALLWCVPGRGEVTRWCSAAGLAPVLAFVRTNFAIAASAMLATALLVRGITLVRGLTLARGITSPDRRPSAQTLSRKRRVFISTGGPLEALPLGTARRGRSPAATRSLPWAAQGRLLAPVATAAAVAAACCWTIFPSASDFLAWCSGQLEIAAGYTAAMSLPGHVGLLVAGASALPVWAALVLVSWRGRWNSFAWWTVLAGPVLLSFRHSFVRQDDHMLLLFPFLTAAASLGLLFATKKSETTAAAAVAALALVGGLYALRVRDKPFEPLARWARGPENWLSLLDARDIVSRYRRLDEQSLAPARLPEELVAPLREPGIQTDVVPWALGLVAANDLRWTPNPTLQLYSAYTERLDQRVAAHFASARAPEALLVHFGQVDDRNPFWDTPRTWRAVLAAYRFEAVAPDRPLVLLRRRDRPARWVLELAGTLPAPLGAWVPLPAAPPGFDHLFAEVEVSPTARGRLETLLLRTAPFSAQLELEDGTRRTFRLVPGTLSGGILVDPAPRGIGAFARIASGQSSPRASRMRWFSPRGHPAWRDATVRLVAGRLEQDSVAAPGAGAPAYR
jgi:hypothetical protein